MVLPKNRLRVVMQWAVALFLLTYDYASASSYESSSVTANHGPFPPIDYHTQTPWGTHAVSIEHRDIDYESLNSHQVNLYDAIVGVVARRIMSSYSNASQERDLGDFDGLNDLLKGTILTIPDINKINAGKYLFSFLFIWIRNMKCFDISVENIIINHQQKGTSEYDLSLDIENLSISCDLDWRYEYSFFAGEGSAAVTTSKSDASVTLKFKSLNFDLHPPSDVEATNCNTAIEIDTLKIEGGIVASITNLFSEQLSNTLEGVINDVACEELNSLGKELLGDVLEFVSDTLENYLDDTLPPEEHYLYPENNLSVPNGTNLLDFSTLGKNNSDWFQTLLKLGDNLLRSQVPDPDSPTGVDYNINVLLRKMVLNDNRAVDIPLSLIVFDGHDMLTETIIELNNIKLFGLDTINMIDSLESTGNYTLLNHFGWDHINVELDFNITIKPSTKDNSLIGEGSRSEVYEEMTITAGLRDIDVDFHFLLAVDKDKIGALQLGSITNISNIVPCALDTLYLVQVSGFAVDAQQINTPTLSGFLSPGIDRIVSDGSDAVFNMYQASLTKALPNIFQMSLRKLINDIVSNSFSKIDVDCPKTQFPLNTTFLNLGDLLLSEEEAVTIGGSGSSPYGHVVRDAMTLVENEVLKTDPIDGKSHLNELFLSKLTAAQSGIPGSLLFPNELGTDMRLEIGELQADIELKLSDAAISNLDSVGDPLKLINPIAPQRLNNTLAVGVGEQLHGSVVLTFGFDNGDDIQVENIVELSLGIGGVVNAAVHLSMIENTFMNFPIEDVLNPYCWLSLMPPPALDAKGVRLATSDPSLALEELSLALTALRLNVTCISCTSPLFEELASLLSSQDAVSDIKTLINQVVNYITNLLGGSFLQVQIDRILAESPFLCPHNGAYVRSGNYMEKEYDSFDYRKQPSDSISFLFYIGATIASCSFLIFCTFCIVQFINRKRQNRWIATLSEPELAILEDKQKKEEEAQYRLNTETTAMVLSPSIPLFIRILIPIIILGNIGFFMSGHLSLGASVDFDVNLAGEEFTIKEIFSFSMAQSVVDMWTAGAKELAILILVFSGAWPYMKQFAVLVLWFMPPTLCSVGRRETVFLWLDILGKWSFIDIFVLILSLASFRVAVITPDNISYLPKDFLNINLLVIPCWGLYSNMIAQFISQINSHFIIHYHRKIKDNFKEDEQGLKGQSQVQQDDIQESICKHSFDASNISKEKFYKLRPFASVILICLSVSFVTLLICGCVLPSYSLEQFGLLGLVSSKPLVEHDIFSTVKLLMDQASLTGLVSDRFGLTVLSAVLILTVLIVPCVQLTLTLVRWFVPLSQKARRRIFVAIEALSAWQYIEVYLLSIVVASWQLGGVSEFLINDYCSGLEDTFAMLQYNGILGINEAQCFRVSAKLEKGMWILMVAAIIFAVINNISNTAAAQQEGDWEVKLSYSESHDDPVSAYSMDGNDDEEKAGLEDATTSRNHLRLESAKFTDYYRYFVRRITTTTSTSESQPRMNKEGDI